MKTHDMHSHRPAISLIAAAALLAATAPVIAQTVVADFTDGTGTDSASHQFAGKAGDGWSGAWGTAIFGTGTTVGAAIGAGDWLDITATAGSAATRRTSLYRKYESGSTGIIDTTKAYSISFSIRFDDLTGFTAATDYIGIFDSSSTITNSVANVNESWNIQITGDNKEIRLANGNKSGSSTYISSGITIETGKTYSFTINLNPADKEWTASITSSSGATWSSDSALGFRASAADLGTAGRTLHFNTLQDATGDLWKYSLNGITITQSQVPEPRTTALLGGIGAFIATAAALRLRSNAKR